MTEQAGLTGGPTSADPYRSEPYFELERERVFKRAWLCIGRIEQLPKPGSYITTVIECWNAPIVITRDQNNNIQAFYNVCAHRANQVVLEKSGEAFRFSCAYHQWTYKISGELVAVPDKENFTGLDFKKCGLRKISTSIWEGWIFLNYQDNPEISLLEFLGDAGKFLSGVPWCNSDKSILYVAHLQANWKVIADAFAEAYHVPYLHRNTLAAGLADELNPFGRPLSGRFWGMHRQASMYAPQSYTIPERAIVEKIAYANLQTGNQLGASAADELAAYREHPAVNPGRSEYWGVDLNWIFPNILIDFSPGGFWQHRYWPISVNSTRWEAEFYMPNAKSARHRLQQEHYTARTAEILLEDVTNTERTQRGLESLAHDNIMLQDSEVLLRHNLAMLNKWIEAKTASDAISSCQYMPA